MLINTPMDTNVLSLFAIVKMLTNFSPLRYISNTESVCRLWFNGNQDPELLRYRRLVGISVQKSTQQS